MPPTQTVGLMDPFTSYTRAYSLSKYEASANLWIVQGSTAIRPFLFRVVWRPSHHG
jgi:hypothetical protein